MRYTLQINQAGAKAAGLLGKVDLIDLALFDAFKDFANSNKCEKKFEKNRVWFWISYKMLVDEIPFVPIKTKDAIYRRMKNLAAVGVIEFHPDNQKIGKSFFAWGKKYDLMISEHKAPPTDEKPYPYGFSSAPPTDEKPYNHSTNNHSTNTNKEILSGNPDVPPKNESFQVEEKKEKSPPIPADPPKPPKTEKEKIQIVVARLNEVCGTRYLSDRPKTISAIKARLKEGRTYADFDAIIQYKYFKWGNDPQFREYLRPDTLFNGHFEDYLEAARLAKESPIKEAPKAGDSPATSRSPFQTPRSQSKKPRYNAHGQTN